MLWQIDGTGFDLSFGGINMKIGDTRPIDRQVKWKYIQDVGNYPSIPAEPQTLYVFSIYHQATNRGFSYESIAREYNVPVEAVLEAMEYVKQNPREREFWDTGFN